MNNYTHLVSFSLDGQRYALALAAVVRVVGACAVTPLPGAPPLVMGVIDMEGLILPVLNIRRRFQLAEREIIPSDQFLIARTTRRVVALVVDEALEMIDCEDSGITDSSHILSGLDQIRGVIKLPDGLVLICDLEKFLSLVEEDTLDEAARQRVSHVA